MIETQNAEHCIEGSSDPSNFRTEQVTLVKHQEAHVLKASGAKESIARHRSRI